MTRGGSRAGRMFKLCLLSKQVNFSCGSLRGPSPDNPMAGHGFLRDSLLLEAPGRVSC